MNDARTASSPTLVPSALRERLVALRRDLHQHPELAFAEERTSGVLARELERLSPRRLDRVARTGWIARIAGRNPDAPAVAIRGDMDALPIQEATGLPFASTTAGVMRAVMTCMRRGPSVPLRC